MSKLRLNITMSLDGFVTGPNQSEGEPLGVGGGNLHDWLLSLAAFREAHGEVGGEVNASTPIAEGFFENVGASVMGRNMFGGGPGPWGDNPWNGTGATTLPFIIPSSSSPTTPESRWSSKAAPPSTFVTGGIEAALDQ